MTLIERLIEKFIGFLTRIPPRDEYISTQSMRYWLLREELDRLNGPINENCAECRGNCKNCNCNWR